MTVMFWCRQTHQERLSNLARQTDPDGRRGVGVAEDVKGHNTTGWHYRTSEVVAGGGSGGGEVEGDVL